LAQQRTANGHALHFAPAQSLHRIAGAIGEADAFEQLHDPGRHPTTARDPVRQGYVLGHGKMGQEMKKLKDDAYTIASQHGAAGVIEGHQILTVQEHATLGGGVDTRGKVQQRGLSASASPHECNRLTGFELEGHIVQRSPGRAVGGKGARDVLEGEEGRRHAPDDKIHAARAKLDL